MKCLILLAIFLIVTITVESMSIETQQEIFQRQRHLHYGTSILKLRIIKSLVDKFEKFFTNFRNSFDNSEQHYLPGIRSQNVHFKNDE